MSVDAARKIEARRRNIALVEKRVFWVAVFLSTVGDEAINVFDFFEKDTLISLEMFLWFAAR